MFKLTTENYKIKIKEFIINTKHLPFYNHNKYNSKTYNISESISESESSSESSSESGSESESDIDN